MQSRYISALMELAEKDKRVLHLLADSGTAYDEMFRRNFPEQIFNLGIAEENLIGVAAGLAMTDKIPFVFNNGTFLAYRAMEFIRNDVCMHNANVKIVGFGSGVSIGSLGSTHHTTEEIGVLRSLPNLSILSPATPLEVVSCVRIAYEYQGPVYIRIGMNHEKEFFEEGHSVSFGTNEVLSEGEDITFITTGSILDEVDGAAEILRGKGHKVGVIHVVSLKPFDEESIRNLQGKTGCIVTVEEHNIYGGLGSIVADVLADNRLSLPLWRIGLNDCFAFGYGTVQDVRKRNGLDAVSIVERVEEWLL